MPEWTKAQQSAIDARQRNILVSAAAGSGKTAVLVERVVRIITDEVNPIPLDRLLVVTFTNAAAAEMKNRIAGALTALIKEQPNNTNAMKQLSLVSAAQICTIDSFCMNLVRENFFQLDIAQDFNILDASQQLLLEQSTLEEIVEALYRDDSDAFKALVELLSTTKNDDELMRAVKRVHGFVSAQPYPALWLKSVGELYQPDIKLDDSPLKAYVVDEVAYLLDYICRIIEEEKTLLDPADEMYEAYAAMLESDGAVIATLVGALKEPWDKLREVFHGAHFISAPRAKKGFVAAYKERLLALRKLYAGADGMMKKTVLPLLAASADDFMADNRALYPVFQSLLTLVQRFDEALLEKKKELNAYTFSDIEHFAIQLLFYPDESGAFVRTELANELERGYSEILVDEYQDTNTAQDTLFEMLSNGRNRFMVGDVKQSIYRFRLAMPTIFNDKKNTFVPYEKNSDAPKQKIILDKNFRSRTGICEFTNFLFSHLMSRRVGELDYRDEDYLHPGAVYPDTEIPSAQLNIVDVPDDEDTDEYEARQVAAEILRKIRAREQVRSGDATRDLRFADIAVLMRSAKKAMPIYVKVFSQFGIPTLAGNRTNLFENQEVAILLSLLRVVDNPVQDIPLLATLMSVFYGYSAEDIAHAKVEHPAEHLYSSVQPDARFTRFVQNLDRYRSYAASMSVENLLRRIMSETSYLSLIAAMGNYEQRRLNVMKLVELAARFDSGESIGLTAFIRYADRIAEAKLEVESAEISGYEENAVQLMSIHKSKGLEFPVVMLAGAARRYNYDDNREAVLLNHQLGVGLKVNNEEQLYRYESLQYSIMKNMNLKASMSENLRVLYVAVTRAKEQFIAFASYKDAARHITAVSEKLLGGNIPVYAVEKAACDGDLLLLCAMLHRDGAPLWQYMASVPQTDKRFDFAMRVRLLGEDTQAVTEETAQPPAEPKLVEEIREKLAYRYERSALAAYASKRTASTLDEKEQSYQFFAKKKPAFLSGDTLTGAEKGTAMHQFMQYCDYQNAKSALEDEIERLLNAGYLTALQAKSLSREKLAQLFSSDFAKRMFESDRIYREIKVSAFVPLCELEDTDYTDQVLVQGIADCVFEENGELVLVDYKTDYVTDEKELLALYRNQIAFYKRAVAKTLGKPVKEAMLYSFSLGKTCIY